MNMGISQPAAGKGSTWSHPVPLNPNPSIIILAVSIFFPVLNLLRPTNPPRKTSAATQMDLHRNDG